ncbi:20622_t:CDS:1, partial [Gigaspora rosea]
MEPDQIKEATLQHFKNWTKFNPLNEALWQVWKQFYEPIMNINKNMFDNITQDITLQK